MVIPDRIIDVHAHILPGIDDGAKTLTDSIEIARWLAEQGVTDVIATPHFVDESEYVSTRIENSKLLVLLQNELRKQNINIRIHLGNEIYICEHIAELISAGKISTLAGSRYILVELPLDMEYPGYEDYLRDLIDDEFRVVLAHPERYSLLQRNYKLAKSLRNMGVLFQCNYGSLSGKYGIEARNLVHKLAKDKMIFTLGSDAHRRSRTDYVTLGREKLLKYYNEREISELIRTNPEKILTNRD